MPPDPHAHDELDDLRDASPRAVYRWALNRGWTVEQAGNLAAWFAGLPVVDGEDSPTGGSAPADAAFASWVVAHDWAEGLSS